MTIFTTPAGVTYSHTATTLTKTDGRSIAVVDITAEQSARLSLTNHMAESSDKPAAAWGDAVAVFDSAVAAVFYDDTGSW